MEHINFSFPKRTDSIGSYPFPFEEMRDVPWRILYQPKKDTSPSPFIRLDQIVDTTIISTGQLTMTPRPFSFLKNPVNLAISFEDGMVVGRNKELELIIVSNTPLGLFEKFELEIETLIAGYLHQDDSILSEQSLELKEKLKEFLTQEAQDDNYEFKIL